MIEVICIKSFNFNSTIGQSIRRFSLLSISLLGSKMHYRLKSQDTCSFNGQVLIRRSLDVGHVVFAYYTIAGLNNL